MNYFSAYLQDPQLRGAIPPTQMSTDQSNHHDDHNSHDQDHDYDQA